MQVSPTLRIGIVRDSNNMLFELAQRGQRYVRGHMPSLGLRRQWWTIPRDGAILVA